MREIDFDNNDRIRYKDIFHALESTGKSITEYETIFAYTMNASPKLVTVIAEDILSDWSCDNILFYLTADKVEKRVLLYRQAYMNGLSTSSKNWLMIISVNPPRQNELYDISLEALANKVPFGIVQRFWSVAEYSMYTRTNSQMFNMFLQEGFDISQSLYLTYISIRYPKEVLDECKKLFETHYDIEQVEEKVAVKYGQV